MCEHSDEKTPASESARTSERSDGVVEEFVWGGFRTVSGEFEVSE